MPFYIDVKWGEKHQERKMRNDGHKGSMIASINTKERDCWIVGFHSCQPWSTLEEPLKKIWKHLEVMGVFEEVSKVVPLWNSYKNIPHRNML
jgi:hypothetical protein